MRIVWIMVLVLLFAACEPAGSPPRGGDVAMLAQSAGDFEQARPGVTLQFPRDHGAHPGFRIEWWYLTANLQDRQGRPFGAQWTLFRTAIRSPGGESVQNAWQTPQVYMAHMAITTPDAHAAFQRYARGGEHGGVAQAGVTARPFAAWLDDWSLHSVGPAWLPLEMTARQGSHAVHLRLSGDREIVLHGEAGYSRKHPQGGGSFYYSQPFLRAEGVLEVAGDKVAVTGEAWLDREWSSQFLQPDQSGWDWFALHLDSGEKLMLFRLRPKEAGGGGYLYGALLRPEGGQTVLDPGRIELEVLGTRHVAGRELPLHWRVRLPQAGRDFEVRALHPDQWMNVDFAYWEGVVQVTGEGPGNRGRGYLELTGYASR